MKIDLLLKVTPDISFEAKENLKLASFGHLGTHFDVMDKVFPLAYTERKGIVFDVHNIRNRDIETTDIDMHLIEQDMFVAFYTGFMEETDYGTKTYCKEHPQLSRSLIEKLITRQVSIIGIDCAGVRRSKEHREMDQYCADHGVFIVENLCNLKSLFANGNTFIADTYPMHFAGMTGLPSRVVADI